VQEERKVKKKKKKGFQNISSRNPPALLPALLSNSGYPGLCSTVLLLVLYDKVVFLLAFSLLRLDPPPSTSTVATGSC